MVAVITLEGAILFVQLTILCDTFGKQIDILFPLIPTDLDLTGALTSPRGQIYWNAIKQNNMENERKM